MKKILHIVATPRKEASRTLSVSEEFLKAYQKKNPDARVDTLNLFEEKLPELTVKQVDGKYMLLSGKNLTPELETAWKGIVSAIERFLAADAYLLSVPMWNFGIPYVLKHYIDVILQPKYLFKYTSEGPQGLVVGKKIVIVTSRGGDYKEGSPARAYDLQEPYLKTAFGFAGFKDVTFINAQPMDAGGPDAREAGLAEAKKKAIEVAGQV